MAAAPPLHLPDIATCWWWRRRCGEGERGQRRGEGESGRRRGAATSFIAVVGKQPGSPGGKAQRRRDGSPAAMNAAIDVAHRRATTTLNCVDLPLCG